MPGYGQFCPVTKTATFFAERWTPPKIRELWVGSTRFNMLRCHLSPMSKTPRTQRLREPERRGHRAPHPRVATGSARSADPRCGARHRRARAQIERREEAPQWAGWVRTRQPDEVMTLRAIVIFHAATERIDEVRSLVARTRRLDPALRLSDLSPYLPYWRPECFARRAEGLPVAGGPE